MSTHRESILCIPDTPSRAPLPTTGDSTDLEQSVEAFILSLASTLPANSDRLVTLQTAQAQDETLSQVAQYCRAGWPQ